MRMFSNYQDLANNYIPNNLMYSFPSCTKQSKLAPVESSKPYEEYDVHGELIGYFWHYGDTVNLDFTIDGEITVETDAIIFSAHNMYPTNTTEGFIGQRCYNVADFKSWTCVSVQNGIYYWTEDAEFTYPSDASQSVYMSAEDYLRDKEIDVVLYNFRMEPICKRTFSGSPQVVFQIDAELSATLVKGIYYCSVNVYNSKMNQTIFDSSDCKLLVK